MHLPVVLAGLFVGVPLVAHLAMIVGLRETPVRSVGAAQFMLKQGSVLAPAGLVLVALGLYVWSEHSRDDTLYAIIVLSSLLGARIVAGALLRTFSHISYSYLDPHEWLDLNQRGDRWQYEMRQRFIDDPEYVDALVLSLIETSNNYAEFLNTLRAGDFPSEYRAVLSKRLWGPVQPSVYALAHNVVPNEVFVNERRFSSHKAPGAIFDELRALTTNGDKKALMDRWQYYWCLRNLNLIDRLLKRALGWQANIAVVFGGAGLFALGVQLANNQEASTSFLLRSFAAGSLVWLLFVASGASLLIVRVFRGTGTFAIADPCRGKRFDPLWSEVIKVGIVSFTVSFIIYGIGSPFLLDPGVLVHFNIDGKFVAYAAASFAFCALVFANHTSGVHDLMLGSRTNALDRVSLALKNGNEANERLLERFREVRELRVWPLRGTTLAQLIVGIGFPVAVQAILLYSGLKTGA